MSITIDRAGRIVVPKALRERFGLHAGTELEIEAVADGLRLRPRDSEPAFIEKDGVLVHHAAGPALDLDVAAFINRERNSRATMPAPES
jgi:AbrB family looped-hinge helix DNA binding protein